MESRRVWTRRMANALKVAYRQAHPEVSDEAYAMELIGVAPRTLYYWASNADDTALKAGTQHTLDEFFKKQDEHVQARFYALLSASNLTTLRQESSTDASESTGLLTNPGDAFDLVARDVLRDLLFDSTSVTDALEMLDRRILAIARDYSDRSLTAEFAALRSLRDGCKALDGRAPRPGDRADLFAIRGMSTVLMASIAFDLGHWQSAAQLAEAATAYGSLAGHRSLEAWTLGLEGTIAFWSGQPGQAVSAVERGLAIAPTPASRFRLENIAARAYAVAGDRSEVARRLELARQERDAMADGSAEDALHDQIGGEFAFNDVRASACATAAWLKLKDGERTEVYAQATLDQFDDGQSPGKGPVRGAQIDLAAALVLQGDVDRAREHLAPILSLPDERRNVSLASRIENVRQLVVFESRSQPTNRVQFEGELTDWLSSARQVSRDSIENL